MATSDKGSKQEQKSGNKQSGDTSKRGFASMDPEQQREIAAEGGRAAHQKGTAHEFTSEEARKAGAMIPFVRQDMRALRLHRQHGTGFDCAAVHMHGAGAALAGVTAHMGAGEHQVLSQRMHQQGVGRNVNTGRAPVDRELDLHLAVS
mgnify:CR=1 FL=1